MSNDETIEYRGRKHKVLCVEVDSGRNIFVLHIEPLPPPEKSLEEVESSPATSPH